MKKAVALIGLIIVITFLAIIVFGITTYIGEALRYNISNINQGKALYMAQAGVMAAIVDYEDGGSWDDAQDVNPVDELYYQLGEDANFLRVDASSPRLFGGNKKLNGITLYNINASDNIAISSLVVSWTSDGGETLTNIDFAGGSDEWTGSASSGNSITLSYTFNSGSNYSLALNWGAGDDISGKTIAIQFNFTDNSSYEALVLDSGSGADDAFLITATGEVRNGALVKSRRTLSVTYDVGTSEITSWEESQDHL